MYFPPAGGGGVQRSLKLAQYLPALGVETHVLAPDDPKWVHTDSEVRVPTQAWVHRARYLGPRARKPAEELAAADGLDRALVQAQVTARRLLLPDASVTWNLTAIPAAIRIVRREGIDVVITTSPPPSVHFVGAAVQKATGARWIADLRDPLVANQHRRDDTTAARARQAAVEQVARLVARQADAVTCVSEAIADEVRGLGARGAVRVISNGCDFDDFAGLEYTPGSALPHHPHGKLLRQARSEAVPAGVPRREPRRGRAVRRRLPLVRPRVGGDARSRRSPRARRLPPAHGRTPRPARLRGAAPAHPRRGRARQGRPLGEGVRVHRRRPADPRRRSPGRGCGEAHPGDGLGRRRRARRRRGHARRARGAALALRERRPSLRRAREARRGQALATRARRALRFVNGGLPSSSSPKRDEDRLSRRARVEEMAALVEEIT